MFDQSDVTVLLVLKGRENFTPRWLNFHQLAGLSCPVIIGDGIPSRETGDLAKKFEERSGCSVSYMPFDERSVDDYYRKLRDIVRAASTKFIHLCANDDFISPFGLAASAKFLKKHKEYVTCGGAVMGFFLVNNGFDLRHGCAVGAQYVNLSALYPSVDNSQNTAWKRVAECLVRYTPTYYAVHRKDALLETLSELIASGIRDVRVAELFIAVHMAIRGCQKLCPGYLGYLRQRNSSQTYASLPDFFESAILGSASRDVSLLLASLTRKCAGPPGLYRVFQSALISHFRMQFIEGVGRTGVWTSTRALIGTYLYTVRAKIPFVHWFMKNTEWSRLRASLRAGGADEITILKVCREIEMALSVCKETDAPR